MPSLIRTSIGAAALLNLGYSRIAGVPRLAGCWGLPTVLLMLALVPHLASQPTGEIRDQGVASDVRPSPVRASPPVINTDIADLAVSRTRTSTPEIELVVDSLIGSLRFTSFGIVHASGRDPAMPDRLLPIQVPTPFLIGEPTGTDPSEGLLFWSGHAFARDASPAGTRGNAVIADVEISIASYVDPRANISFSGLFDLNTGASREAFGWTGVPVQDGAFSDGTDGNRVEGTFFGPSHYGVGGSFERDGLVGGFGAERKRALPLPSADDVSLAHGETATRLLDVVMGGPPSVNHPVLGGVEGVGPLFPEMELPLEELPDDLAGFFEISLRLNGVVGAQDGDRGELALTLGLGPGLAALGDIEFGIVSTAFAGEDGQAGYSAFKTRLEFGGGDELVPFLDDLESTQLAFGGFGPMANPIQGSARWEGTLRAEDVSDSRWRGNQVSGNVAISLGLQSAPEVNIEFSNLVDHDFGRRIENISWTSIPISKGSFIAEHGENFLQGAFAGYRNTSVAGIFEWDDLSGGFVAAQLTGPGPLLPLGQLAVNAGGTDVQLYLNLPSLNSVFDGQGTMAVSAMESLLQTAPVAQLGAELSEPAGIQRLWLRDVPTGGVASDLEGLGGWLQEGYFGVAAIKRADANGVWHRWASAALMVVTGSQSNPPDVSATWAGEMAGIDISGGSADGNLLRGSASVRLRNESYLQVTVAFSDIVDLTTGYTRPDMWWGGLPVVDGQFGSQTSGDEIAGIFLGSDQSKVTGAFEWRMIQGAFGARIQEP